MIREQTGGIPPVLDSRDVLENPRGVLEKVCQQVELEFCEAMLEWPPGFRDTDGVWAKHWYAKVEHTTTFAPYRAKPDPVPESLRGVLAECNKLYEQLYQHRITTG